MPLKATMSILIAPAMNLPSRFAASFGNVVAHFQLTKIPEQLAFPDLSVIVNVERQRLWPGSNVVQVAGSALDCADNSG